MENQRATNSISKFEKVSIACGLAAIFPFIFGIVAANYVNREIPAMVGLSVSVLLLGTGMICGLIAFFKKRTWAGLLINLVIAAITIAITLFIIYMNYNPDRHHV